MSDFAMHQSQTHAAFKASDMSVVKEERFVFKTEWYDKQAALIREYLLTYYPKDCTAEMVSRILISQRFSHSFVNTV